LSKLPFIPNHLYKRRADIHAHYGGNWQSGISASANFPYIFIFSGKTGHQHGYKDGWDNPNIFAYTGEYCCHFHCFPSQIIFEIKGVIYLTLSYQENKFHAPFLS
jgi:hypothetical protein